MEAFEAAINEKTKLIFIANPNNPTGNFLTETEIDAFLAKVPSQIIVVLDEAYTEFTKAEERVDSFGLLQKYPNLIISRSLSKAYGLAGLRIGYAVSNPEIADLLNRVRQPFNCNSLALASAVAVMNDDSFVKRVQKTTAWRCSVMKLSANNMVWNIFHPKAILLPLISNNLLSQFTMRYCVKV